MRASSRSKSVPLSLAVFFFSFPSNRRHHLCFAFIRSSIHSFAREDRPEGETHASERARGRTNTHVGIGKRPERRAPIGRERARPDWSSQHEPISEIGKNDCELRETVHSRTHTYENSTTVRASGISLSSPPCKRIFFSFLPHAFERKSCRFDSVPVPFAVLPETWREQVFSRPRPRRKKKIIIVN
jgi:hypothetical protein